MKVEIEYRILEQTYIEKMCLNEKYSKLSSFDKIHILFPNRWFYVTDYEKKINLLKEAIEKDINVCSLEDSLIFEEGVHRMKK